MPSQIAYVRIVRWKSETTQRRKAPKIPSDQRFDVLGHECDQQQAFGLKVCWPLHHHYYCRPKLTTKDSFSASSGSNRDRWSQNGCMLFELFSALSAQIAPGILPLGTIQISPACAPRRYRDCPRLAANQRLRGSGKEPSPAGISGAQNEGTMVCHQRKRRAFEFLATRVRRGASLRHGGGNVSHPILSSLFVVPCER